MFSRPARLTLLFAASLLGALPAPAETPPLKPPQPAAPTDAAFDAEKAAFLALPLATRVAAQDALVWLGLYNGTSDGEFGKRTRDSIVAFQLTQKGKGDGVLSAGQLQALLEAGQKAEAGAGFKTSVDPKTGARIGTPTKLIDAKSGVTLDFALDASGDLLDLYARLAADTPTRKVAYKALKPGAFFVVSGLDGGKKFYARYELETGANPPVRGFEFAYPAGRKDLDRVALAVANSFVAFPQAGAATGAATPAAEPPTGSAPPPQPAAPSATALIVAPGRALTALKPEDCPNPSVAGKPARFERSDAATGLAMLSGDFGAKAEPPPRGALAPDLIVLSADGERVAAMSASLAGGARPAVVASLDKSAAGGPVFDRSGGLAGLVAPVTEEPRRVGGVALAAPHPLIDAEAIDAFLGGGTLTPLAAPAPLSAGAIAARKRTAVAAVTCGK
ncbi:peptidoglycan-binding domain-containing protein [Roseiarcus sp.]|uniref:peptidoglycan-binding domain-containing protein n=1 Tax=Roseiarcus sp. TaxID=1969460 RepID=UPI003F9551C7